MSYVIKATKEGSPAFIQLSPMIADPLDIGNHCNLTDDQELLYQQLFRMIRRGEKDQAIDALERAKFTVTVEDR